MNLASQSGDRDLIKEMIQLYVDHRRHTVDSKTEYMIFLSTYGTSPEESYATP